MLLGQCWSIRPRNPIRATDESHDHCGVAAGLAAIIADEGFTSLHAPIKRVSIPPVPVPYAVPLEEYVTPLADRIVEVARELVK